MFDIKDDGSARYELIGRFDASHADRVREVLDRVNGSCIIDFAGLDYISSAGLGVLLRVQKRLMATGDAIKLINLNSHIREIFHIAGFDSVFDIE